MTHECHHEAEKEEQHAAAVNIPSLARRIAPPPPPASSRHFRVEWQEDWWGEGGRALSPQCLSSVRIMSHTWQMGVEPATDTAQQSPSRIARGRAEGGGGGDKFWATIYTPRGALCHARQANPPPPLRVRSFLRKEGPIPATGRLGHRLGRGRGPFTATSERCSFTFIVTTAASQNTLQDPWALAKRNGPAFSLGDFSRRLPRLLCWPLLLPDGVRRPRQPERRAQRALSDGSDCPTALSTRAPQLDGRPLSRVPSRQRELRSSFASVCLSLSLAQGAARRLPCRPQPRRLPFLYQ